MTVIDEIAAERRRQIEVEGWSAGHDDEHQNGALAKAAAGYAEVAGRQVDFAAAGFPISQDEIAQPDNWPWDGKWFKPKGPRRNLVMAAALLVAEIERLDRAAPEKRKGLGG